MFRINTFEIRLPPLRERTDDILPLARHLVTRKRTAPAAARTSCSRRRRPRALRQHTWPGNVRELANVIEHATILCDRAADPPGASSAAAFRAASSPQRQRRPHFATHDAGCRSTRNHPRETAAAGDAAILDALDRHGGNKPKAAEELGISLKTLYNKLNQAAALDKTG